MEPDALPSFARADLERLKLAAEVILRFADDDVIPAPLEAELVILRDPWSTRYCCPRAAPLPSRRHKAARMAQRRRAAGTNDNEAPPGQASPTVAEVVAMLASIVAATARVEGKLDKVLAELASLPRPAGRPHPGTRWHGTR